MRLPVIAVLLSCLFSFDAVARPAAWEPIAEKDGMRVAARSVEGSGLQEVRVQGIIDASPEQVLAILLDVEAYPKTMPYTAEARVLKREGDAIWLYQVIDAPLASKRDLAMKITVVRGPGGRLGTQWILDESVAPPLRDGIVRVPASEGSWDLVPIRGGKATRATYRIHSDPGGDVPGWIVNRTNKTAIPDAFLAVRKAAVARK